jgi:hypothetical protein
MAVKSALVVRWRVKSIKKHKMQNITRRILVLKSENSGATE